MDRRDPTGADERESSASDPFGKAFASTPSSTNWNALADLNHDNAIDIFDAIMLANNFGKHL